MHSGPFGCLTKLGAKRAELVQKFVPRSRVGIFHNERSRSTPLDPKLTFCYVSYYLDAFGTVRLPYETWCKMGGTSAKVRATKSHRNFSHLTHPIHPLDPKLKILVRFLLFGCIWNHLVALRTHPIHHIGALTDVLVHLVLFGSILDHLVALRNSVLNWSN